jgi:hypothetical protein
MVAPVSKRASVITGVISVRTSIGKDELERLVETLLTSPDERKRKEPQKRVLWESGRTVTLSSVGMLQGMFGRRVLWLSDRWQLQYHFLE